VSATIRIEVWSRVVASTSALGFLITIGQPLMQVQVLGCSLFKMRSFMCGISNKNCGLRGVEQDST
jgi:hypothetical protein